MIRSKSLASFAWLVLAVAGCSGEGPDTPGGASARLRAIHLSPDAPAVDVFADGAEAFAGLQFPSSSSYAELPDGTYDVAVAPAGTSAMDAVLRARIPVEAGRSYTAIAFDRLAAPIQALLVEDETDRIPAGSIRIRAIHAAAGIGQVDIWDVTDADEPVQLVRDLAFGEPSETIHLPAAAARVGIDADDDAMPDLLFDVPALPSGTYANLFAVADAEGNPFLFAQLPDGSTARLEPTPGMMMPPIPPPDPGVRVLHLSPDAPAVDVLVDGAPAFTDIPFTWGSGFTRVAAGRYTFEVVPTGAPASSAVLRVPGFDVAADTHYTVVAWNRLGSIQALALTDDMADVAAGTVRVRAVHTAAGVGPVDVWLIGRDGRGRLVEQGVEPGSASGYLDIPAASFTVALDANGDTLPDAMFDVPGLVAGTVSNLFAVADDAGLFLLNQLPDGNTVRIMPTMRELPRGQIRALHLASDAPPVDVFLNSGDAPIISALPFGDGTTFASLLAGAYRIDVAPSGAGVGASVLTVDGFDLPAGRSFTVVAYGRLASIAPLALSENLESESLERAGTIRVRAVHTASGVGDVDIYNVPEHGLPTILYENVPFGTAGDYLEVPAGQYRIGLDIDDDRTSDALFRLPALGAGAIANLFAVSDLTSVFLVAQLADGTTVRIASSH